MTVFRTLHRSILILFLVVVVSIVTLAHFSISKIVAEQSRAQQQSISPALSLIVDQLMQPLHVSQTLSKAKELRGLMQADKIDEKAVIATLQRLSQEFGMYFFIASDVSGKQYDSDGQILDLKQDHVKWYIEYKNGQHDAVADIGKWEDPHFYIDLKIYDDDGRFLGFFGTGKGLSHFLQLFQTYKENYGYDFLFVDRIGRITLSSDPTLVAANIDYQYLVNQPWYAALDEEIKHRDSLNNLLIRHQGEDYLVAEVKIDTFDWTMYLLSPLQARQQAISRGFIVSIVSLLVVIFVLFLLVYNLLYYYKKDMQRRAHTDSLTQLPNREALNEQYELLMDNQQSVSLLLLDLDHFKKINDQHGHSVGDLVLTQVARMLREQMREHDVFCRWGGEEFVILLPDTEINEAERIAQQLRFQLATLSVKTEDKKLQVTGSFGLTFTSTKRPLSTVMAQADQALYKAKHAGRNQVQVMLFE